MLWQKFKTEKPGLEAAKTDSGVPVGAMPVNRSLANKSSLVDYRQTNLTRRLHLENWN